MSSRGSELPGTKKHAPYVPETMEMKEFTLRAVLLGLFMTVVLGAANAYLGLRAGMTIAATYPAAVIGMAAMRAWKGSLLEENIARTAGSIGESVAAGAIFTLPAFLMAKAWPSFRPARRLLEIHRPNHGRQRPGRSLHFAGPPRHGGGSRTAFPGIGGRVGDSQSWAARRACREIPVLEYRHRRRRVHRWANSGCSPPTPIFTFGVGSLGRSQVRLGPAGSTHVSADRRNDRRRAQRESGLSGRRLHHRSETGSDPVCRKRAGLGLAGSAVHLLPGTATQNYIPADTPDNWANMADAVWRYIVRPIAVGGMLVGAAYTLFKMRTSLTAGIGTAFADCVKRPPSRPSWRAPNVT